MSSDEPVQIGTDRKLFLDEFWTAASDGVVRRLHKPVRREAAIRSSTPGRPGCRRTMLRSTMETAGGCTTSARVVSPRPTVISACVLTPRATTVSPGKSHL